MLKCKECGRQTEKLEPTAKIYNYREVPNGEGKVRLEISKEKKVCHSCFQKDWKKIQDEKENKKAKRIARKEIGTRKEKGIGSRT